MPPKVKRVQYGVTEAISFGGNEAYDKECSQSMEQYLLNTGENLRESPEQATHRETVLCTLGELLQTWIQSEYVLLGHSNADDSDDEEEMLKKKNVYFCTFGSYRLGVNAAGADIDALCVGPRMVGRDRFFDGLVPMLRNHRKISKLLAVPGAYVPVIKMCLDGIEIDLLYACINVDYVPLNLNLLEDKLLFGLEEVDMRCLNGSRVTDMILSKLIPHTENFRAALVLLKYWAKRRAVHSNVMGFLPGVAISLLCARICQLYPDAEPAHLIHKFFHFFGKIWQWPMPIMLTDVYTHHRSDGSEFEVWDPKKNHLHSRDLMPILTPSFPSMNSTYTVSESTLRIMKRELLRGFAITSSMYPSKGQTRCSNLQKVWTELCQPSEFFKEYKVYLAVVAESASTPENHDGWKGFVTSKIRKFVSLLERSYSNVLFHPYPVPNHVEIDNTAVVSSTSSASSSSSLTTITTTTTTLSASSTLTPLLLPTSALSVQTNTSTTTLAITANNSNTMTTISSSISAAVSSSLSSSSVMISSASSISKTNNTSPTLSPSFDSYCASTELSSPSSALSTEVVTEPPAKITRDTYYIGVEPRTQGQTLYLADVISSFLRMLAMEGQTEDMVANVEVIPAKELRRLLKIPAPRRKKVEAPKEEVKEQPTNGEVKPEKSEDSKPLKIEDSQSSLSEIKPAPSLPSNSTNGTNPALKTKRETPATTITIAPSSTTTTTIKKPAATATTTLATTATITITSTTSTTTPVTKAVTKAVTIIATKAPVARATSTTPATNTTACAITSTNTTNRAPTTTTTTTTLEAATKLAITATTTKTATTPATTTTKTAATATTTTKTAATATTTTKTAATATTTTKTAATATTTTKTAATATTTTKNATIAAAKNATTPATTTTTKPVTTPATTTTTKPVTTPATTTTAKNATNSTITTKQEANRTLRKEVNPVKSQLMPSGNTPPLSSTMATTTTTAGTTTQIKVDTKPAGTTTQIKADTEPAGTTIQSKVDTKPVGTTTQIKADTKPVLASNLPPSAKRKLQNNELAGGVAASNSKRPATGVSSTSTSTTSSISTPSLTTSSTSASTSSTSTTSSTSITKSISIGKLSSVDSKNKAVSKPGITIVTSHFKPKPPPKPAPAPAPAPTSTIDTLSKQPSQEEKDAVAKRFADKKQELARLRQQLIAPKPNSFVPLCSPNSKPQIPQDFLSMDEVYSHGNQTDENGLPETPAAKASRLELLHMRQVLAKKLAELDETLAMDESESAVKEAPEDTNKRPRVEPCQRNNNNSEGKPSMNNLPSSVSPVLKGVPGQSISSSPANTAASLPPSSSFGEAPAPKTKEEKKAYFERLKQKCAKQQQKLAAFAALNEASVSPSSPMVHPASPVIKPASPLVKPASPVIKPTSPVTHPPSPMIKPASPMIHPASPAVKPMSSPSVATRMLKRPMQQTKTAVVVKEAPKDVIEIE